jgi:hypothetical protein
MRTFLFLRIYAFTLDAQSNLPEWQHLIPFSSSRILPIENFEPFRGTKRMEVAEQCIQLCFGIDPQTIQLSL